MAYTQEPSSTELTEQRRQELQDSVVALHAQMSTFHLKGDYAHALGAAQEIHEAMTLLHRQSDHIDVATSLNNVGFLLQSLGRLEKALPFYEDSLAMRKRLFKHQDHPEIADGLNNIGTLYYSLGQIEQALACFSDALALRKRIHQDEDHPNVASSLSLLGFLLHSQGEFRKATPLLASALEMRKRLYRGQDHADLAQSHLYFGILKHSIGQSESALVYCSEGSSMYQRIFLDQDHPQLAVCLTFMGSLYQSLGQYDKALPYSKRGLAMYQRVYKNQDHPDLANALNSMGNLLHSMQRHEEAIGFYEDALTMRKRLFQNRDHPDLAQSLNLLGCILISTDAYQDALPYFEQSYAMQQRLYQDQDHPELIIVLHNLGTAYDLLGQHEKGIAKYEMALAMHSSLRPNQDHPDLAMLLLHMAQSLATQGRVTEAVQFARDAMEMKRRLGDRFAYATSLTEALSRFALFSDATSAFLTLSRDTDGHDTGSYEVVWSKKATLAQLFRSRRQLVNEQESNEIDALRQQWQDEQRRLTGMLNTTAPNSDDSDRDRRILVQEDKVRVIEARISRLLPDWKPLDDLEHAGLQAALHDDDVFVDIYRYEDWQGDSNENNRRYVAFVSTPGELHRVELGAADPIDAAVVAWRRALFADESQVALNQADAVRRLLWSAIEDKFPTTATRIFISADGDLGRVPFAALPGAKTGSILLEHYSIAMVESGPFLLEQLNKKDTTNRAEGKLLVAGGIQYDTPGAPAIGNYQFLDGTNRELRSVLDIWKGATPIASTGHEATTAWLLEWLPDVRYAHLATHGEVREEEFAGEQLRRREQRSELLANNGVRLGTNVGSNGRNPLDYVGIVMAGANSSSVQDIDRGVVSGASIWPLDLSKLKLAVLSACDTGLGANTRDAGVANLTLAMHVAGCENVIASLWKVNDDTTAALMAKFYEQLWLQQKTPLQALRAAQLYVYQNPRVAMNWRAVAKRGETGTALRAPKVVAASLPNGGKRPLDDRKPMSTLPKKTPVKYWAAFVLSGVGE